MISMQALSISEEVQAALRNGQAVVALESTIITHGEASRSNMDRSWYYKTC